MNRRIHVPLVWLFLIGLTVCLGCEPQGDFAGPTNQEPDPNQPPHPSRLVSRTTANRSQGLPVRNRQTILIASFNIQVFGQSKMSKPGVPEKLAEIIRQFDIVAIQEIRDRSNESLPLLLRYINQTGPRYDYIISQPLGRTNSKEQYAFVFNTETIVSSQEYSYLVEDRLDHLHREPLVARFVTRVPQGYAPWRFTLANFHSDPDEAKKEIEVLNLVLRSIREFEFASGQEDDVIIMGDLNVEPKDFGSLAQVPGLIWLIQDEPTNTIRTKTWDNILFDRDLTNEFTGRAGVLDLESTFRMTRDEASVISDHLPIWGEFYATEQPYAGVGRSAVNPGVAPYR
jgi:deoxyribonuclease-1-like protein